MIKKFFLLLVSLISIAVYTNIGVQTTSAALIEITTGGTDLNVKIGGYKTTGTQVSRNDKLTDFYSDQFYSISGGGERGLYYTLLRIARDFKNIMYLLATVFFFIITIRLLLSGNTEEELGSYKKGVIWITVGLIVMQIAYSFVASIYDQNVTAGLAYKLLEYIIYPLVHLLETLAAIFFLAMAFYAFYRMITANGDEEKVEKAKKTIIQAIIGYLIIKFAKLLVEATYGTINCTTIGGGLILIDNATCLQDAQLSTFSDIIVRIINWANSFIAIIIVLLIIYAGFQIMLSGGDDEKIKKGKNTILYIAIGLFILAANYLILTFFILPETTI